MIFRLPTVSPPLVPYCILWAIVFLTIKHSAILETVRSEKKRKMENVTEFGFYDCFFDPIGVDYVYQEEWEEKTQENSEGDTTLRSCYSDF